MPVRLDPVDVGFDNEDAPTNVKQYWVEGVRSLLATVIDAPEAAVGFVPTPGQADEPVGILDVLNVQLEVVELTPKLAAPWVPFPGKVITTFPSVATVSGVIQTVPPVVPVPVAEAAILSSRKYPVAATALA